MSATENIFASAGAGFLRRIGNFRPAIPLPAYVKFSDALENPNPRLRFPARVGTNANFRKVDLLDSLRHAQSGADGRRDEMSDDQYEECNTLWPTEIPALTRAEASRAMKKLARHFGHYTTKRPVRRCWITTKPDNRLHRGWRRLVHDMSHRIHARRSNAKPHGGWHAELETEMVRYVLAKGWLTGTLRSPEKAKPAKAELQSKRQAAINAAILRWESKRKRAETALKKLRRRAAYYQRNVA